MLQQDEPDDYVLATGETHSVKEFVQGVFDKLELDVKKYVEIDPRYFRPAEVDMLLGDSAKAKAKLGWEPRVKFDGLIDMMVESDMELANQEKTLRDAGHDVAKNRWRR
jgi:GDPmannose 4,6-dehydratase